MAKQQVVSVGDICEVEAIRLNDDGEGVVSIRGFTVFVPGLLPHEKGRIEIRSTGKSFARANLLERFRASKQRADAPCLVFDRCGGCQLQHLSYENQLLHKLRTVEGALHRVGKFATQLVDAEADLSDSPQADNLSGRTGANAPGGSIAADAANPGAIEIRPVLGMSNPWRYRNNVQVPVRFDGDNGYEMGFYAPESHSLVPADVCLLEPVVMEKTARAVAQLLAAQLGHRAASIHHLILRYSFSENEIMVVLSMDTAVSMQAVAEGLLALKHIASVAVTVQPNIGGGSSVWGDEVTVLAGKPYLTEQLRDVEYRISPRSFFQVNPVQTAVLYEQIEQRITLRDNMNILDAYCGTGTIALWLAQSGAAVTGIESIKAAVHDARLNAEANQLENATFKQGRVEQELPQMMQRDRAFDVVVVDPPRKGLERRVLDALVQAQPAQIVYVSCNPSTLARDLRIFADNGFQIGTIQPVDMFPQTSHVECCVSLTKKFV